VHRTGRPTCRRGEHAFLSFLESLALCLESSLRQRSELLFAARPRLDVGLQFRDDFGAAIVWIAARAGTDVLYIFGGNRVVVAVVFVVG
jgi:hypothetical protein